MTKPREEDAGGPRRAQPSPGVALTARRRREEGARCTARGRPPGASGGGGRMAFAGRGLALPILPGADWPSVLATWLSLGQWPERLGEGLRGSAQARGLAAVGPWATGRPAIRVLRLAASEASRAPPFSSGASRAALTRFLRPPGAASHQHERGLHRRGPAGLCTGPGLHGRR